MANVANYNHGNMPSSNSTMDAPLRVPQLRVPRVVHSTRSLEARCKRSYDANAHLYFINSVSASPDQGTFISADDLCIHLWNLEHDDGNQIILDMRPVDQDYSAVCSCRQCFVACMTCHSGMALSWPVCSLHAQSWHQFLRRCAFVFMLVCLTLQLDARAAGPRHNICGVSPLPR